jgi:hypothetical protein
MANSSVAPSGRTRDRDGEIQAAIAAALTECGIPYSTGHRDMAL